MGKKLENIWELKKHYLFNKKEEENSRGSVFYVQ